MTSPPKPPLLVAGASHPGMVRDQNEDRLLVDEARGIFGVVDGVGGHPGGEQASAIAIAQLTARLSRDAGSPADRLREAITLANNAIHDAAGGDASLRGMACVLTAAVVTGDRLTVGHVGDTRLYKLRNGAIRKLTRDHSPVGEREDAGEITEMEAMRHPRRNEVYRDVGAQPHAPDDADFVEIAEDTFEPDAAVLLCSDGLSDLVPSATLRRIVEARAGEPQRAVEELIRAANDAGGKDNVSVIVVEGPGFAAAVKSKPSGDREGGPRSRFGAREWLLLVTGVLLGLLAAAAALWTLRPELFAPPVQGPAPEAPSESRVWRVGLGADADAASISEALGLARPGDTIQLAGGEYREHVVLREPLTIRGPREAVIRPPLGTPPGWTALAVSGASGARLEGFTIASPDDGGLAVGIRVDRSDLVVDGVSVSGAAEAGLLADAGAVVAVSSSAFHDNQGSAIVARRGARLVIRQTTVLRNGTAPGRPFPGIRIEDGAEASLVGNAIGDNGGAAVVGLPADALQALTRHNLVRPVPQRGPRRSTRTSTLEPARPVPVP